MALNGLIRRWYDSRQYVKGFPHYVSPEVMRAEILHLLALSDAGSIPADWWVGNVVMDKALDGKLQWLCFRETNRLEKFKDEIPVSDGWPFRHTGMLSVIIGTASLWCRDNVFDAEDNMVPPENREVLDPEYLLRNQGSSIKTLRDVIREAPVVRLQAGDWRKTLESLGYESKLAAWCVQTQKYLKEKKETPEVLWIPSSVGEADRRPHDVPRAV